MRLDKKVSATSIPGAPMIKLHKQLAAGIILTALLSTSTLADDSNTVDTMGEQQIAAASIEWALANCPADTVNGVGMLAYAMTSGGSTPDQMAEARKAVQAGIAAKFKNKDEACSAVAQWLKAAEDRFRSR